MEEPEEMNRNSAQGQLNLKPLNGWPESESKTTFLRGWNGRLVPTVDSVRSSHAFSSV